MADLEVQEKDGKIYCPLKKAWHVSTPEDFETTEHDNDCVKDVIEEETYDFIYQCDGFNHIECDLGQWQRIDLNNKLYDSVIETFNKN